MAKNDFWIFDTEVNKLGTWRSKPWGSAKLSWPTMNPFFKFHQTTTRRAENLKILKTGGSFLAAILKNFQKLIAPSPTQNFERQLHPVKKILVKKISKLGTSRS